ncbi:MAG: hypothetical protein RLZZ200_2991, partial [Pseudomonadota bacterium]
PGYQQLLADVRSGAIDVIVAEDVSRLWRNMAEQGPRLAEIADLGVFVVTHDFDSRQENAGLLGAVMGASSESYRREIARRTRRGLEGRARAGAASGSKAYGYVPASVSGTGQIEINAEQAEVVRWIFERYADGWAPIAIARDLNQRGVPSPGATLKRADKVPAWSVSTIAGDARRGLGILNVDTYRGVKVWGRTARVRSAADSQRRRCILKPRSEWVVLPVERLRIVSDDLWQRVKARQESQSIAVGGRVADGIQRARRKSEGKRGQYLFSGLLRCDACGSRFVMADDRSYICSGNLYGRGCTVRLRVRRSVVEDKILQSVREDLLSPEVLQEVRARLAKAVQQRSTEPAARPTAARIRALKTEIGNLTDAIAGGMLRASKAVAERLYAAEEELARLEAPAPPRKVTSIEAVPALLAKYQRLVAELERTAAVDMPRARTALQNVLGDAIGIRQASDGSHLEALVGLEIATQSQQVSSLHISVVPRAGVEPATPRLGGECSIH